MKTQIEKAVNFHKRHTDYKILNLYNIWDAGSAKTVSDAGALAIATSSWSIAVSQGYDDGENIPRDRMLQTLRDIAKVSEIPLTCDIEAGYGNQPEDVAATITAILEIGYVGVNLEDKHPNENALYSISEQSKRLGAARKAAEAFGVDLFINARTDEFFLHNDTRGQDEKLLATLERAEAYAQAGSNGLFVPNLIDLSIIEKLCQRSPLPVNIMVPPNGPKAEELSDIGVSRISNGPFPYIDLMGKMKASASLT